MRGRILAPSQSSSALLEKLGERLEACELAFGEPRASARSFAKRFLDYVERGTCILGSPLLTNVGAGHGTLSSCAAIPIDSAKLTSDEFETVESYYGLNMGSGYNLDSCADPVGVLLALNAHASGIEASKTCERYIGNIAHLSVRHPRVAEFASAKIDHSGVVHFNTSIDVDDGFMNAVGNDTAFELNDGNRIDATQIWSNITEAAWECGDPGIISLSRFNQCNSVHAVSPYVTTAPCAEVGLANGETCVFGYINLAACLGLIDGVLDLDCELVGEISECLTRVLDDALELSVKSYPHAHSRQAMLGNRKIGIGVCGFADALLWLGVDYGSEDACNFLRRALSVINFRSKHASMKLAQERSSFSNFLSSRYLTDQNYLLRFAKHSSEIHEQEWSTLASEIPSRGLRNAMTTALPPSGRSSILLGVNASIEPFLQLEGSGGLILPLEAMARCGKVELESGKHPRVSARTSTWPKKATSDESIFRTSRQLSIGEHLAVLGVASKLVDDGISKTVNLPSDASIEDVDSVFRDAWAMGLKAISIYRDKKCAKGIKENRKKANVEYAISVLS